MGIKEECEKLYKQIKDAEDRLYEIRIKCNHPSTVIGNWSYRVGQSDLANICTQCGVVISPIEEKDFINFPHKQLDMFKKEEE